MKATRLSWLLVIAMVLALGAVWGCGGDDDDDNAGDDDVTDDDADDDAADDDATDDDATDDDATDDDAADDDATDDDAADDDATDDDGADDDTGDDDSGEAERIINGDFETGEITPWGGEWPGDIVYCDPDIDPYEGLCSVWLGGHPNNRYMIEQPMDIPSDLISAHVFFGYMVYRVGNPSGGSIDVSLWDEAGTTKLVDLVTWAQGDIKPISTFKDFDYELTADEIADIAGQTVQLRFDNHTGSGGVFTSNYMITDAISFHIIW